MKTIVLANAKGGTGKTIVAINLSACLALHHGKRVLGIDLDPQGNFGISYGIDPRQLEMTSYHMLLRNRPGCATRRSDGIPSRGHNKNNKGFLIENNK